MGGTAPPVDIEALLAVIVNGAAVTATVPFT
jgi:hypothetical protein